jgi:hypothetical protein
MTTEEHAGVPGTGQSSPTDNGAGKNPFKEGNNPFKDVQNILGFLLAGFGGIISFLGLQSTEVSTVLRNDPVQASVVAAILTAGMLAAVLTVVINSEVAHAVAWPIVIAIGCLLVALGGLLVYSIPASDSPSLRSEATAALFCVAGLLVLGWYWLPARSRPPAVAGIVTAPPRKSVPRLPLTVVFLLAGVTLISMSAYGAMRLETASQRSSSAQVAAALNDSDSAITVHVTASKVVGGGYIWISVQGLPATPELAKACKGIDKNLMSDQATCEEDPCGPGRLQSRCVWLMNGSVAPDASGDVNDTMDIPIKPGQFQDLDIRASICTSSACGGTVNVGQEPLPTEGSRVDVLIPQTH